MTFCDWSLLWCTPDSSHKFCFVSGIRSGGIGPGALETRSDHWPRWNDSGWSNWPTSPGQWERPCDLLIKFKGFSVNFTDQAVPITKERSHGEKDIGLILITSKSSRLRPELNWFNPRQKFKAQNCCIKKQYIGQNFVLQPIPYLAFKQYWLRILR